LLRYSLCESLDAVPFPGAASVVSKAARTVPYDILSRLVKN